MVDHAAWTNAVERARAHAPFLARALDRQSELAELLAAGQGEAALAFAQGAGAGAGDVGTALRRERLALATAIAIGDLAGAFPLARVVAELTAFADRALDAAIRAAIAERTGENSTAGFIALALGKQGAGELNYSSDIDPILLYDPARLPCRAGDDPGEAAQRYTRRIVKLLSETTAEGYVLRVDLRLRPASEISPLAVAKDAALAHYQSLALAWERAAFTRARAAAGDIGAGEAFLAAIRPFVWRQTLDFGAIDEIRQLTRRIRESQSGPTAPGPGFDVKRGRGGIREVEFYAQTHQLIHGGRDPSLRVRGTREALDALAAAGRIPQEHAATLGANYDRLRVVEHRLQMVGDRQTHSLPDGEALDAVARLDGLADGAALIADLGPITASTAAIYEELIGEPPANPTAAAPTPPKGGEEPFAAFLEELGFAEPQRLCTRLAGWRDGRYQALRSAAALAAFDALAPQLFAAIARSDDPSRALARWETILERSSSAITLFRLLNRRPDLLDRLVATLTLAPMLSDELARHPGLMDIMLDADALALPGSPDAIADHIERSAAREDYEALLDAIRRVTGELRFALGVQLIEGLADPLAIGAALSRVAEGALRCAVRGAEAEFAKTHGRIAGSELVVVGLGRLGGGALTHASDLDIVFLFTGDHTGTSDGPRPLGATRYFNRLASRVSAALSVPTAQGTLYEVDTRLRPQGAQGPLAVSLAAFEKYQSEAAWTWEHMALARARVLEGSNTARAELEGIFHTVLHRVREPETVRKEVTGMRAQMARHKAPAGPLDVKRMRGGLVDCEFLVHFLQLRGTAADGSPLSATHPHAYAPDLAAAIPALAAAGLLPVHFLKDYDLMSRILVAGRLLNPGEGEPPACAAIALARACRHEDYDGLLQAFAKARQRVRAVWNTTLGEGNAEQATEHQG
ncbi:MAG: bifunctional [glutamate--ammonia ligase]-adenylyl-L-tyrosine phosphorylase/[glutamate--ammonia-ligase] adenylyltransferase [Erythrobacter sp.]|jgi:glutamate-ammonia-ligase adenylyltransferase|nr:bifunctional [glutamate--ammonia ligase]-adenylyl-L-tyrosine phosphorylase/[glutamate--ammonia-ligase] adenylyltransferase [Erythrobacter sp.]